MRQERYTTGQLIAAIQATRGIKSHVATALGCSRMTVDRYIRVHPTVARAYTDEREKIVDIAEDQFFGKIESGVDWAVKWALATLGKDRGYTERKELDVKVHDVDREIESELAKLAARSQDADAGSVEGTE